jgi:hypothetical protein
MTEPRPPLDLRHYARSTQVRLALGALGLLFLVGGILIYIFYGPAGAALGVACFVLGLLPVLLILGALWVMESVLGRSRDR